MKADSKYCFERNTGLTTSYILQSHEGADLPNFPATYQRTPKNKLGSYPSLKGKQYVNFREMCNRLNPVQKDIFPCNPLQRIRAKKKPMADNSHHGLKVSKNNIITNRFFCLFINR